MDGGLRATGVTPEDRELESPALCTRSWRVSAGVPRKLSRFSSANRGRAVERQAQTRDERNAQ
jgi:hypothetical protein